MLEVARHHFDVLARLGDRSVSRALLEQHDQRAAVGSAPPGFPLMRANLLRRCGDLAQARSAFVAHLHEAGGDAALAAMDHDALAPPGLKSHPDYNIAPLIVIDDFLPVDEMAALHRYACEEEAEFFDAPTNSAEAAPDPDKRRTLAHVQFTYRKQFFLDFLEANLARFQRAFGLPAFAIDWVEIKLTNHCDGGFFAAHADNHKPVGEAGRAITWLYYFGKTPLRHEGGDLLLIDTRLSDQAMSPSWFTKVEAVPNRLVAFPSWFNHAVAPTRVPGNAFADGRFAVSSHVRKPADGLGWTAA